MSIDEVFAAYRNLRSRTEAFAALGARLGAPEGLIDPAVREALDDVLAAAGIPNLGELTSQQRAMIAEMVSSSFRQAGSIIEEVTAKPGWEHTDPEVLDGQGRASTNLIPHIADLVGAAQMRSFLDVGTGVGLLAIAAAQRWPDATVVGIDMWEPALERARENVAAAGLVDRVEIRHQDISNLDESGRYDCAFIPAVFLPVTVLATVVARVVDAMRLGGLACIAVFREPQDPLIAATQALRVVRDCGAAHSIDSVIELCRSVGIDATLLNPGSTLPVAFVGARVA